MEEGASPLVEGLQSICLNGSRRREVGESILLHRPAVSSVRRSSGSRFLLQRGGADKQLNVCIVPMEPCRMEGENTGWG